MRWLLTKRLKGGFEPDKLRKYLDANADQMPLLLDDIDQLSLEILADQYTKFSKKNHADSTYRERKEAIK